MKHTLGKKLMGIASCGVLALIPLRANAEGSANVGQAKPTTQSTGNKSGPAAQTQAATVQLGSLAACQPSSQVSAGINRLVEFADPNGDGKVSRVEATSAANFFVGGFFFRADENGDGVVTPQEGLQARKEFVNQNPMAASLLRAARDAGATPFKKVAQLLDIEYGQPVKAEEARQAARSAVDDLFKAADNNKDGNLTFEESRAATWRGAQAVGETMFRSIDSNNDGTLGISEFQQGLQEPAKIAFKLADENSDGKLTQQEAANAMNQVVSQIGTRAKH